MPQSRYAMNGELPNPVEAAPLQHHAYLWKEHLNIRGFIRRSP